MSNYVMTYDEKRCIGCQACNVACTNLNSVPDGFARVQVQISAPIDGHYLFTRKSCRHCENSPCVGVCPTGASYVDENGVVRVNGELCIDCKYCMSACPYNVRYINEAKKSADKCDFCSESRLANGELPACVTVCPADALKFYKSDDPELAKWLEEHAKDIYQEERENSGKSHLYFRKEVHGRTA